MATKNIEKIPKSWLKTELNEDMKIIVGPVPPDWLGQGQVLSFPRTQSRTVGPGARDRKGTERALVVLSHSTFSSERSARSGGQATLRRSSCEA